MTNEDIKNAIRYKWLRKQFAQGEETYIGEWVTDEQELDKYIDEMLEQGRCISNLYKRGDYIMNKNKCSVIEITSEHIKFNNDWVLYSEHEQDCCEHHYLDFTNLSLQDFEGFEFDLTSQDFFERIPEYGIALKPLVGHPVRIPGYGYNNGYYSSNLDLVISDGKTFKTIFNITDCQEIED